MSAAINFSRKLDLIKEHWTPKVIAQMNDYQFKLVKVQGDFVWHSHADTDETFIVLEGELRIDLRDARGDAGAGRNGRGAARRRAQTACRARGLCSADRALRVRNTGDGGGDGERPRRTTWDLGETACRSGPGRCALVRGWPGRRRMRPRVVLSAMKACQDWRCQ